MIMRIINHIKNYIKQCVSPPIDDLDQLDIIICYVNENEEYEIDLQVL